MPHTIPATIVEQALEHLGPHLVAAQEAHAGHDLEPHHAGRHIRIERVAVRKQVAEHQVRHGEQLIPHHLDGFLARPRLRDPLVDRLDRRVILRPQQRQVRQQVQRVDRRRIRIGRQHLLVAHTNERLLSQRRLEELERAIEDALGHAAEARIGFVARLRQRGGGGLTQDLPIVRRDVLVELRLGRELEQERRIGVFGEQAEQQTPRCDHRRRILVPAVLEQAAQRVDRADTGDASPDAGRGSEHRGVPCAFLRLRHRELHRRRVRV